MRVSIALLTLFSFFAVSESAAATPFGLPVTWDCHSLLIDGRRVCPVMGEIHYSRLPADEWATEVRKMREGGVTIIATYIFWNHIEEEDNRFDWSGQRNLRRFLEVCKAEGMPVVLRMGPWCHGEVRNGGLPEWLFERGCKMRSEDGIFLAYAERLYRQIFTQVQGLQWKDGGPVIAAQFDNEYRGPASYLLALKRIALAIGFDLPFYTRTGWPELSTPMPFGEMLPLYGDYADGFWDKQTTEGTGNYYQAFNFKKSPQVSSNMGAPDSPTTPPIKEESDKGLYPYFTCELGGGMATAYHRRPYIYTEDTYSMALVKLGSGSNLLGYYMYHGGTNPASKLHTLNECQTSPFTANNDLPVCTYDFQAPLGEFGQANPQYYALRPLHLFMHDFGEILAPMEAQFPGLQQLKRGEDTALRWSVRSDADKAFLFINNYERLCPLSAKKNVHLEACGIKLPALTIPAGCMAIFPVNLPVGSSIINYATAQPVAYRDGKMWFEQKSGVPAQFCIDGKVRKVRRTSSQQPFTTIGGIALYLITTQEAEHLFLPASHSSPNNVSGNAPATPTPSCIKVQESGPLRTIIKGRAKVAAAPTEAEWQQAAVYHIKNFPVKGERGEELLPLLSITYRGDCARLYANGRLIADNFYYGRPFLYGLWRLPVGCSELELRILPLQPSAPIYLPREADHTAGEEVKSLTITFLPLSQ